MTRVAQGRDEKDHGDLAKWYVCLTNLILFISFRPICPIETRQTMLFSATPTTKVEGLVRISLRPGAINIDVEDSHAPSTVDTLSQGYVVCPSEMRFLLLFTFLKMNVKKDVIELDILETYSFASATILGEVGCTMTMLSPIYSCPTFTWYIDMYCLYCQKQGVKLGVGRGKSGTT